MSPMQRRNFDISIAQAHQWTKAKSTFARIGSWIPPGLFQRSLPHFTTSIDDALSLEETDILRFALLNASVPLAHGQMALLPPVLCTQYLSSRIWDHETNLVQG